MKLDIVFKTLEKQTNECFLKLFVFFEILRMKKTHLYQGIIKNDIAIKKAAKEEMGKRLKKYSTDLSSEKILWFVNTVIDVTGGISDNEYYQLQDTLEKEQSGISDLSSSAHRRVVYCKSLLTNAQGRYGELTLDKQVEFAIKKLDFLEKFSN